MAPTTAAPTPRSRRRTLSPAARRAGTSVAPAVVLRAVPPLDPPCEETVVRHPVQPPPGMDPLPADWRPSPTRGAADAAGHTTSAARTTAAGAAGPSGAGRSGPAGRPTRPAGAHAAMQRYVGICVEILNGYRPSSHLRPLTHPRCFSDVSDQLLRRTVRIRMSPSRAARHGNLVRVRRVVLCEPLDGIAEAAVVLEQGDTSWAMAVRLERGPHPGAGLVGWHCTLVQVI